jgi:membrane associated rhomboid family serine protease
MTIDQPAPRQPIFGDIPLSVLGLAGAIFAVSALVMVGPRDLAIAILWTCALQIDRPAVEASQPLSPYAPYALHVFVHGGWMHVALNLAGLLAFGAATARRLSSPLLFLVFFFLCSISGAIAEAAAPHDGPTTMLGASSGVFGLVAGATYARIARSGPLPSLLSRAMLVGLAPWAGINLLLALGGGLVLGGAGIAWVAHLGGLAAGALLFPLFDRIVRGRLI